MLALLTLLLAAPGVAASEDTPKAPKGPDGPEAPAPPPGRDTDGDEDGEPQDEADDPDDDGRGPSWMRRYNLVGLGFDPLTLDTGRPKFAFTAEIGGMLLKTKWQDKSVGIGIGLASMLYGREFVVRGDIPLRIAMKPGFVDVGGGIAWPVTDFDLGTPRQPMVHGFGRAGVAALGGQLGVQGMVSIGIEPIYTAGIFVGGPGPGRLSRPSNKAYEDAHRDGQPRTSFIIQEAVAHCRSLPDVLTPQVVLPDGIPAGAYAIWNIQEIGRAPQRAEEHPMYTGTLYLDGGAEVPAFLAMLDTRAERAVPGSDTVFDCSLLQDLTHAFRVYDQDGSLLDCVVIGHDPVRLREGPAGEPSNPEELGTCRRL